MKIKLISPNVSLRATDSEYKRVLTPPLQAIRKKTMKKNKNLPYYLIAIGIFILFKLGYKFSKNDSLIFLLKPIDKLVGLLTGSNSVYITETGYFHNQLNIFIDKSCAGFNFWIISFLMLTFLGLKNSDNNLKKLLTIPLAITGAYFLTILVNTSRIFASIVIQNQTSGFFENQQHIIHEAIGIVTNLSFLILVYFFIDKILTKRIYNAKLT
ncbi:MAG: exosortase K [Candidatus Delongbacteria bacterium]|jgi:exosortase K|nr:exosortase K [Candidatus Delongbacteria bacterium]